MKKLYSVLAASAVVFAASATEATPLRGEIRTPVPRQHVSSLNFDSGSLQKLPEKERKVTGLRKVDGIRSIEGQWSVIFGDYYFEDSSLDGIGETYTASVNDTKVTFKSNSGFFFNLYAELDEESNKLTFTDMYIGKLEDYYIYQQPFIYNEETYGFDYQDIYGTLCVSDNVIVFSKNAGIYWGAYSSQIGSLEYLVGAIDIYDLLTFYQPIEGNWNDIGNATFMDGWLLPAYLKDQNANKYQVPLQQNVDNENLYRLVNPYKYGPLADMNGCETDGYIVFDVTDPDHVVFKLSDAGFSNPALNVSMFFPYNTLGVLSLVNPTYTPEELVENLGDKVPYTTFKNGVVSLDKATANNAPDARFGMQYNPVAGAYWSDESNNLVNMTARILFPGVSDVNSLEADNSELPVEFFNLQGVRIQNPQPGQIVIRRQGDTITKEIVR